MSSIPQRKKSPEELAALRAQELASHPAYQALAPTPAPVPVAAPPPAAISAPPEPPARTPIPAATPSPIPAPAPSEQDTPTRLRKTPPLKHGHLHAFEGLRPAAAAEVTAGAQGTHAALPPRKHDGRELQEMRHRGMMQTRPPVQQLIRMELHPVMAGILYIIGVAVIVLTIRYWSDDGTQRYYSPGIGCGSLLLTSLYLYLKKPRARHHAAILSGLCLLVLGFVILLTLKNPHAP